MKRSTLLAILYTALVFGPLAARALADDTTCPGGYERHSREAGPDYLVCRTDGTARELPEVAPEPEPACATFAHRELLRPGSTSVHFLVCAPDGPVKVSPTVPRQTAVLHMRHTGAEVRVDRSNAKYLRRAGIAR